MKTCGLLLILAFLAVGAAKADDGCITCHRALADSTLSAPAMHFAEGVHSKWHISCADCHGGDRTATTKAAAKAPSTGFRGAPTPQEIPSLCGKCHSDASYIHRVNPALRVDQEAQYRTSIHGIRLAQGDTLVATCVSCHGVHGILPVNDPRAPVYVRNIERTCTRCHSDPKRMGHYTITDPEGFGKIPMPTNQGEDYLASVHANALYKKGDTSAPTCTSCHGDHGATPPEVSSVSAVCRQCHVTQADLFDSSPHKEAFLDAEYPECTSCHGNHRIVKPSDKMIGSSDGAVCLKCHFSGDEPLETADDIRHMLDSLSTAIADADTILTRAAVAGMEVSGGRMTLRDAMDGLIQARNFVHSVDPSRIESVYRPAMGKAAKSEETGHQLLHEVTVRRKGLGVALVLIALLAVALIVKIRVIDRKSPPKP